MSIVKRIQTPKLSEDIINKFNVIYKKLSNDDNYGNLIAKKEIRGDEGQFYSLKYEERLKDLFEQNGLPKYLLPVYDKYETQRYLKEIKDNGMDPTGR